MGVEIIVGDCRDVLHTMASESVHAIVTSPPYFNLRDYKVDGQVGREKSLDVYIATMVEVFSLARRVLRQDGGLFLNLGDSYGSGKQKLLVPARVALALQSDGWILRQDNVWAKKRPMPESVRDRSTCAHEFVFHFTRNESYYYDADAVRTPLAESSLSRLGQKVDVQAGSNRVPGESNGTMKAVSRADKQRGHSRKHQGFNDRWGAMTKEEQMQNGANLRSVWHLAPPNYSGGHFATMPEPFAEICIKAGTPEGGVVLGPFGGVGTTGLVADRLGRDAVLIELNAGYAKEAEQRIRSASPLFADVSVEDAA